jgi:asparagine synthase (glutamine-hydrolysing)
MLDGQGADEIIAGYHDNFSSHYADLLLAGSFRELQAEVASYRALHDVGLGATAGALARPFVPNRIKPFMRGRMTGAAALINQDLRGFARSNRRNGSPFPDRFRRHLELLLLRRGLPALLRYEDRNSMAHSLESRVPFLDYRLVELLFALPADQRIHRGWTKNVLRRALHDLLPPPVRDRVDKRGFGTPEGTWLRGELGALAGDVFASQSFRDRGWLNASAVHARLARHRRGEVDAGFELWRALNVELWAQAFVDR